MDLNNSSYANATLRLTPGIAGHTQITLYSILLVWSLIGNVLVIAVVYCNHNLRTNMNYLIVNMAVSDLLFPLIAMPRVISGQIVRPGEWLVEGPLGEALCKLVHFLSDISPFVSSISLVTIASLRFIAVVYTNRRQILTPKTRWILISFPWIAAMVLFSPDFYIFRLTNEQGYTSCEYSWSPAFDPTTSHLIYISMIAIVGFSIPLIATIILYSIVQYKLRKSLNNVIELIEKQTMRSRQRTNRRLFNMSITIVIAFTICWCPICVLTLLLASKHPLIMSMDNGTLSNISFAFFYLLCFLPAVNPCIYFVFLRDFRQGLKRLCCRETAAPNEQPSTLCICCVSTVAPGRDSNQDPPRHIISTSPRTNLGMMQPQFITTSF